MHIRKKNWQARMTITCSCGEWNALQKKKQLKRKKYTSILPLWLLILINLIYCHVSKVPKSKVIRGEHKDCGQPSRNYLEIRKKLGLSVQHPKISRTTIHALHFSRFQYLQNKNFNAYVKCDNLLTLSSLDMVPPCYSRIQYKPFKNRHF